jgi:ankyrin repeat protein
MSNLMSIHAAAESGDLVAVKAAIKSKPKLINAKSIVGNTPVHCAIYQKHSKVAKALIDMGADLESRGNGNRTPLHAAAASGAIDVARLLLTRGVNIEATDDRGETPLKTAVQNVETGIPETRQLVRLLIKSGAKYDIESAVIHGDSKRVKAILSADADALMRLPEETRTILVHSAIYSPAVMELLLDAGGDSNARAGRGNFSFAPLTRVADSSVARILLDHGADVNARGIDGKTRLQMAKKYKETELAQLIASYAAK